MDNQDTSESPSESQVEEDEQADAAPPSFSQFSAKLRAMVRIRNKYQAMKKRRAEMAAGLPLSGSLPRSTSPKIFTFEGLTASSSSAPKKKKKKRKSRVLFPSRSRRVVPTKERSRAKNCLFLLIFIVFLQVYNAIENLDDHVLKYDLEGLEKTLKREVFGQQEATERLLEHLNDYLSTYVHNKPLVLSLNGPSGVGKSHLGRILARHFRSVVNDQLVMQYFVLHHCPLEDNAMHCAQYLASRVSEIVTLAEEGEMIPVLIFDEVEFMHMPLLDMLHKLFRTSQTNEYLNAIYVLISNLGQAEITKFVLQNSSSETAMGQTRLGRDLGPLLHSTLERHHPLFAEVDIIPLTLLQKSHVMDCFLDEMTREGFYPDHMHIERLAGEISYYSIGQWQFSQTGCKHVVAKVNLL
ncbi:torsin-4A isoform X2 [Megalops cyprinoides]|nr:torsin-4A isoform X2 [Megalops cyprinoides]